jgi:hypothetical protein
MNDIHYLASGEKAPTTSSTNKQVDPKVQREKELEEPKKKWDRYFEENK